MAREIRLIGFSIALLAAASLVFSEPAEEESDPILSFYCRRAAESFSSRSPLESGANFSFRARTYYMSISDDGEVLRRDSGVVDYFYSFGELDSSEVVLAPERSQDPNDFGFANVFSDDYEFYFFPNDTGGTGIAIGFDTYTEQDSLPVGLAVIDRSRYFLRWLHLHYPDRKRQKRYSRSFRFVEHDGYVFVDSAWRVSAKVGVFTTEFFRAETGITDIKVYR